VESHGEEAADRRRSVCVYREKATSSMANTERERGETCMSEIFLYTKRILFKRKNEGDKY